MADDLFGNVDADDDDEDFMDDYWRWRCRHADQRKGTGTNGRDVQPLA